jgi:hypothetical protein
MITCKELNKTFAAKAQLFAALIAEKGNLISLKKATIKTTDDVSFGLLRDATTVKAEQKDLGYGDYIYPVINTTLYLDSHNDLHLNGIWDKSAKDQNGKIHYVVNHELKIGSVIAYPKDVEIMVKTLPWSALGKSYSGDTEALIFKAKLSEKSQKDAYLAFKDGENIQQSVRMEYVNIDLAIDSTDKEFKHEKALFDKYMKVMANPEVATERGYFWTVSEAKIYKEGSAVLFGSNDATGTLYDLNDTKAQPSQDTAPQPSINIKQLLQIF